MYPSSPTVILVGDRTEHRLISASDLKRQRGWTEPLVTALLGAPDALCPNPHGWRAPMRWFREDRVLDAEQAAPFTERLGRLSPREAWRREQPTRTWAPDDVELLEWLDDPTRIALFHAPRRPRLRRRPRAAAEQRAPAPAPLPPGQRWEVLRLF
jgi:hypothetical protein